MTGFCRSFMVSILLLLCFGVRPGACQDFLVAKVLDVHVEQMEIEVSPVGRMTESLAAKPGEILLVQVADKNNLPQKEGRVSFPGCVVIGDTIRLWGAYARGRADRFMVTDIRGCRGGGCLDPTGVRSRLRRGRRNSQHSESDVDGGGFANGRGGDRGDGHGGGGGNGGSGGGGGGR